MQGRNLVVGDIHGANKALVDCLDRCKFDTQEDTLICLGDICDGWSEPKEAIDLLLTLPQLIVLKGNHDVWALQWMKTGTIHEMWPQQGGEQTMRSFGNTIDTKYIEFLEKALPYFEQDNRLFVHGGIIPGTDLNDQDEDVFLWDRNMLERAYTESQKNKQANISGYQEVFVGHTPTLRHNTTQPLKFAEVWMLDTGAGWRGGKLTLMDIDTHEYWQSNPVETYYPNMRGRG